MNKIEERAEELIVYLPDTRGVEISRFGKGNLKIGPNVFTYSRLPGNTDARKSNVLRGTCPGSTPECEAICYAKHIDQGNPVWEVWSRNSWTEGVPADLPPGCRLIRLHISGDFTTESYIAGWIDLLQRHPEVAGWAYTRTWRVPELLPALERLRALPNMQLFASMDRSTKELPPAGWRRAWVASDERCWGNLPGSRDNWRVFDGAVSYLCPEQTGRQPNCEACGYCQHGKKNDVTFLEH
jgi:hypothetical protein